MGLAQGMETEMNGQSSASKAKTFPEVCPVQVSDPRSPAFTAEARRQSLLVARSESEADDQAFIDSVSIWNDGE